MRAAVLTKMRTVELQERPVPTPGEGEVLVRIRSVGVCGSDVHYFAHGRIGSFVVEGPIVLGHECSGEIEEVGPGVTSRCAGQRVAIEPGVPCRKCEHCRAGRYNLCPEVVFLATPPVDGAFCEYIVMPEDYCFPVPQHVSDDEAALIEPLATGVYGCERAGLRPGQSVIVLGVGPIGLVTLQAAKAYGAARVIAVDTQPSRLDLARQLGADEVVQVSADTTAADIAKRLPGGADVVFETAGHPATSQWTTHLAKRGGTVVLIGLSPKDFVDYNLIEVGSKELDVKGVFRYANVFPTCIHLVASGRINLRALITHHFGLEETEQALQLADTRKDVAVKVMVHP